MTKVLADGVEREALGKPMASTSMTQCVGTTMRCLIGKKCIDIRHSDLRKRLLRGTEPGEEPFDMPLIVGNRCRGQPALVLQVVGKLLHQRGKGLGFGLREGQAAQEPQPIGCGLSEQGLRPMPRLRTMSALLPYGPTIGGGFDRRGRDNVVVCQVQLADDDKEFPCQTHQGTRSSARLGTLLQVGRTFRCKRSSLLTREGARLFE